MIPQTRFLGTAVFLFIASLGLAAQAASVAVLTPVMEVKGAASWSSGGAAKTATLHSGESLAEGSVITTGAEGRVVFSPVPGAAVSLGTEASVALLRLRVTKSGDAIQSRDALLRLDSGAMSFSLDKGKASATQFGVQTPSGTVSAEGCAGTIAVTGSIVKLASLSGKMSFTATGSQVATSIAPGSILVASGEGADVQIRLINAIARTTTDFSPDGTPLGTRVATVEELNSARGSLETTLAHVMTAAGYGLFSAEAMAEITMTLTQVNQSLAAVGLAPVDATSVGTSSPTGNADSESARPPAGFTSGSVNPANLSGLVVSPEQ